jgi:hypothetical protein
MHLAQVRRWVPLPKAPDVEHIGDPSKAPLALAGYHSRRGRDGQVELRAGPAKSVGGGSDVLHRGGVPAVASEAFIRFS